jgi:RNA polymerase sigma-B factor
LGPLEAAAWQEITEIPRMSTLHGTIAAPGLRYWRIPDRASERNGRWLKTLFRRYRAQSDQAAREELVRGYLPLARGLARRYAHSSEPYEDLVQVASLALVKAIDRFDPDRGIDFRAFAIPTILGELKRYFRDSAWAVHVPRSVQERALRVEDANRHLTNRHGRPPTVNEIAAHLELSSEEVLDGLKAAHAYDTLSLEEPAGPPSPDREESTLGEMLGCEDERYELIDSDVAVAGAVRILPVRERHILYLRFVKEMTQHEIAERMDISQMQVSRLLQRSLAKLSDLAAGAQSRPDGDRL